MLGAPFRRPSLSRPSRTAAVVLAAFLAATPLAEAAANGPPPEATSGEGPVVEEADADRLLEIVRESPARAVLLNVWATWCIPCREEFPDLLRLRRTYRDAGLELILVSGDFPSEIDRVKAFLGDHGVDFTTYLKTGKDMEFIDTLEPRWSGALPVTLVYDRQGEKRRFWQGAASFEKLEAAVLPLLESDSVDE